MILHGQRIMIMLVYFHGECWHIKIICLPTFPQPNYCVACCIDEGQKLLFLEDQKSHGELNDTGGTSGVKRTDSHIKVNFECFLCGRHCAKHSVFIILMKTLR